MNRDHLFQRLASLPGLGTVGWLAVLFAVVLLAVWLVKLFLREFVPPPAAPVGQHVVAAPAPQVAPEIKTPVPVKPGTVQARPARVKTALKLPSAVADNPALAVLDATRVEPDDHATTVTTLLNTDTGETLTLARREPLPWLATVGAGRVWLGAGVTLSGDPVGRLDVEQTLVRIKRLSLTARGTLDVPLAGPGEVDGFAGVGVGVTW